MRVAALYDVHGNLPALEAVLADVGDADRYILGGDYALFGGWPAESVARLRELEPATWIRGNADRWLADPPEQLLEAVDNARTQLGDASAAELAALPESAEDGDMLICHGPGSVGVPLDGDHRAAYAVIDDDGQLARALDHVAVEGLGGHVHRITPSFAGCKFSPRILQLHN